MKKLNEIKKPTDAQVVECELSGRELNTEIHREGLSQLLIEALSGRTSMGSVYNHATVEENLLS